MALRAKLILAGALAFAAGAFLWPTAIANLQSKSSKTTYVVSIDLDDTIVLPCVCKGRTLSQGMSANWTGRTNVSVSVQNADDIPLNYDYSVTAGSVIKQGPNVVWDLARPGPGEYSITATIDDGVGNTGRTTRKVVVAEPDCHCPCECPSINVVSHFTEVQRRVNLDFETRVAGGGIAAGGANYRWTVENGTIISGQGTAAMSVKAADIKEGFVTAIVEIGGTEPACNCPILWSASVPIGVQTQTRTFPLKVNSPSVDEESLYIECPSGQRARPDSPKSDDLILNVSTGATSNSILDKLHFTYTISGGKVIGSGSNVKWNLTGLRPGTYWILADVDDGKDGARSEKKLISLYSRDCVWTPECPRVDLSDIRRAKDSNDLLVFASITGGSDDIELAWDADGAEVIAGQSSRSVRLRPVKNFRGEPLVTLSVYYPGLGPGYCPDNYKQPLKVN